MPPLIWLPDGQFVSLTSDRLQRGNPCRDDFVAIDRAGLMLPAAPDPSLSPGGDYQATTTVITSTSGLLSLSTSIVVTPTSQVMNTVPWSID